MTADEYDTGERASPSDRPAAGRDRAVGGDAGRDAARPVDSRDCLDADRPRGPSDDAPDSEFGTATPSAETAEELLYV
ncbi:hypothetical protein M0R88_11395 [Halorussus gelatinilyticus]|uniref:Uncharacterized protein n=1 Tax=Halorussus gelatinilyticus TaxID=2937524 RepID=A0A8U0IEM3_9EURY|nr:hypothetical protein [Halorussus gelatinilyticus]UPV99130.1 hypothetical protein M0R88_11395 [Halorussus gelatinilyticus]